MITFRTVCDEGLLVARGEGAKRHGVSCHCGSALRADSPSALGMSIGDVRFDGHLLQEASGLVAVKGKTTRSVVPLWLRTPCGQPVSVDRQH